jgi:uncharacterized protein (DUF169 family)
MDNQITEFLPNFLSVLGLEEEPMGLFYTDEKPEGGFSPKPTDLPTREKEMKNEIDWKGLFGDFSCAMGHIWRARKKKMAAYFSADQFGCAGAAFWLGFNKPQTEMIINYVSIGIPNYMEGERYCHSPETARQIFEFVDPRPAPKTYCAVKPLSSFRVNEFPELVIFFSRPESLCGLHQLAAFVTGNPEVVTSPWSAGCGGIAAWPLHYLNRGENKAVIGGWDPSARKYYKTDELSFTIPFQMFIEMIERYEDSFLFSKAWQAVQKKVERSREAWGETK